jgi:hypothetical protein
MSVAYRPMSVLSALGLFVDLQIIGILIFFN